MSLFFKQNIHGNLRYFNRRSLTWHQNRNIGGGMPVATLTLEWISNPPIPGNPTKPGWCVQICGRDIASTINLSSYKFAQAKTAPYKPQAWRKVGTGPLGWVITPSQEPLFGKEKGARPDELPMAQVAEYLEILQEMGYKIAASHSMVSGENNTHKILSWTMQGV